MKKILFLFFLLCGLVLSNNFALAKKVKPIPFKNSQFHLYKFEHNKNGYYLTNRFFADDLELKGASNRSELLLFYSKKSFSEDEFEAIKKNFSSLYLIGKISKNNGKFCISFLGKEDNSPIYSILKFDKNGVSGTQVAQIFIPVSDNKQDYTVLLKNLDNKYFDYFINYNFPPTVDEYGNEVPQIHKIRIMKDTYNLVYARKSGQNYYVKKNRNLANYDTIVRVNYNVKYKPDKVTKFIIQNEQNQTGFKVIRNERIGKTVILSYLTNEVDLPKKKDYITLSIYKIEPYKRKVRTIELSTRIPESKPNVEKYINNLENKYYKFLLNNQIPPFVKENFGVLPTFAEQTFFQHDI